MSSVADFTRFAKLMIASEDYDPVYSFLRTLYAQEGWSEDKRLWFTAIYVGYYNVSSAWRATSILGREFTPDTIRENIAALHQFPRASERRTLRSLDGLQEHLTDLVWGVFQNPEPLLINWLTEGWHASSVFAKSNPQVYNWYRFESTSSRLYGNGSWAAFKWAELLKKVHGLPIASPDMGLKTSSAVDATTHARDGLASLYGYRNGRTLTHEQMIQMGTHLRRYLASNGLELDWEALETVLCNWRELNNGTYYIGHDIALLHDTLSELPPDDRDYLEGVLSRAIPEPWYAYTSRGLDKSRNTAYADHKEMLLPDGLQVSAR